MLTELTDEMRAELKTHAEKWIENGLSTKPMDEHDKSEFKSAIEQAYELIGRKKPRVVFVKSPLVGKYAAGLASALLHRRKGKVRSAVHSEVRSAVDSAVGSAVHSEVRSAVDSVVGSAVHSEVDLAVYSVVGSAVGSAVYSVVGSAVHSAVGSAVHSEVRSAVDSAVGSAVYSVVGSAVHSEVRSAVRSDKETFKFDYKSVIDLSFKLKLGSFGIECCYKTYRMVRGGNMWSGWPAYLTFFKDKANLSQDILKRLEIFEKLSTHGSYYWCHEDFVIVSDRPEFIKLDEQKRSHSLDGPFIQWRDGSGLYAIHGQKVPAYICETAKDKFTKEMILSETNVDYRRFIIEKIGIEKAIDMLGAKVVDTYDSSVGGHYRLLHIDYDGQGNDRPYLEMSNPSLSGVKHIEGVSADCKTVKEAIMYRNGLKKFIEPKVLT